MLVQDFCGHLAWSDPARTEGTEYVKTGINCVRMGAVMAMAMELTACLQEANYLINVMVWGMRMELR